MDEKGAQPAGAVGHDARLVWRLFSPSARLLSCRVRKAGERFELLVCNGDEEIVTASDHALEPLHEKASLWRASLEAHGYLPADGGDRRAASRANPPSEPRAAFRSLLECAELLSLADPKAARELRQHITTGLVAIGLQDSTMTSDVIGMMRETLARVTATGGDIGPLLRSCEALLGRIEQSLMPGPSS